MKYTILEFEPNSQLIPSNEITYITNLCEQVCKILDILIKSHPEIIKKSCFVYVGFDKCNYGINTEAWHCITINPNTLLSLDPPIRNIVCELIISNIKDLSQSLNLTLTLNLSSLKIL